MLRVAVPNKGVLSEPAAEMLEESGYRQRRSTKDLAVYDPENDTEFFYLRPRDIAIYVAAGTLDVLALATIVGSAKGRSISELTIPLPGNSSRTSTHAISVPKTRPPSAASPVSTKSGLRNACCRVAVSGVPRSSSTTSSAGSRV